MPKKPLGIYVHIPFCVRKCLYCDFLSDKADDETKQKYVECLLREIELETSQKQLEEYKAVSVFLGGGTPSTLRPDQIDMILCKLKACIPFEQDAEISMEINPGSVWQEQLYRLHESGVNRISIGAQSLQDAELEKLGRIHRAEDFYRVYEEASKAGFCNRNVDLMSGIPGQTAESLADTLKKLTELRPEHISAYSLIVEQGTPFETLYPDGGVDEETDRSMYEMTGRMLSGAGYCRYEISNYARPGFECRHNRAYWTRQDYIGFGLGAASLIDNTRFSRNRNLHTYLKGNYSREHVEKLSQSDQMSETMFLGLRLTEGVSDESFQRQYGKSMEEVYGKVIEKHLGEALLTWEHGFLRLTQKGMDVSNYVMADFLLD